MHKYLLRKINYLLIIFTQFFIFEAISENLNTSGYNKKDNDYKINSLNKNWIKLDDKQNQVEIIEWEKLEINDDNFLLEKDSEHIFKNIKNNRSIESLNRSIVFNNDEIGPDISWLVPPGFKWNRRYNWDFSTRGHNRRKKNDPFWGWNGGDAVGQFYYQPIHFNKTSFGINLGMRSIYSGSKFIGGETAFGEGLSLGFRIDRKLSNTSGIAFGAEQLLHFDGLTDTGRDIYITTSKAKWAKNVEGKFPLTIGTLGLGTGKMAEGNIKLFCSNLFGGSGTEVAHQRSLCWSPIFTLSRIHTPQFSTFFEYNSKWFLLGSSIVPFKSKPLRGTFAVQLSDHIDNYKVNSIDELKWVFRISYGF